MGKILSSPQAWKTAGQTIALSRRRLFYLDSSTIDLDAGKTPLVMLHGFPTSGWDFHRVWPGLVAKYRLIVPDFLGFGFSQKPHPHCYSILEQADLIETLAAALTLKSCHLLAHDYGDSVAQELLARDNQRSPECRYFRSVCLLNGALFPECHKPLGIQRWLAGPLGPWISRLATKKHFGKIICNVFGPDSQPSSDDINHFWTAICAHDGRHVLSSMMGLMYERRRHRTRWLDALINSHCPIQLINGSADPVSGAAVVERYREIVRETDDIVEFPAIGHYPHLEAPETVLDQYLRFLDQSETTDRGQVARA